MLLLLARKQKNEMLPNVHAHGSNLSHANFNDTWKATLWSREIWKTRDACSDASKRVRATFGAKSWHKRLIHAARSMKWSSGPFIPTSLIIIMCVFPRSACIAFMLMYLYCWLCYNFLLHFTCYFVKQYPFLSLLIFVYQQK